MEPICVIASVFSLQTDDSKRKVVTEFPRLCMIVVEAGEYPCILYFDEEFLFGREDHDATVVAVWHHVPPCVPLPSR